ncbi:MAG TPA: hypothetical protein VLC71_03115 [Thermomonas sp.]|nr:hypothetical protein [Thermomonas sp.]
MARHLSPLPNLLAAAILALLPTAAAWAQSPPPHRNRDGQGERQDDRGGSLSDAVRRVERDTRGEVLSAERVQYDGRDMHRVKVVDDQGRVRVFMQDPEHRDAGATPPARGGSERGQAPRRPPARDDDD